MQSDNIFKLDLASEYNIHELVFINSGSNYYARLPVDCHAALLSDNNSGKTSTLSALKLFLLPEISFKNSKNKFSFASGGKYYSDLDSFQYYFPGTESYIICCASNPRENFCWILYRTTDLGYERIALPRSYDEIEHLFWNADSVRNEKAGEHQPDIGINDIKKKLKELGGKIFTDRSTIGEAIYTRTSAANDHTRFSLLPMTKKFSSASVETVRSLLGMAFSLSNASTTTLPNAIGSIIDGMGMSVVKKNDDGVFIDLDNALDEWRQLKETDNRLSRITAQQDQWQLLRATKASYAQLKHTLSSDFKTLAWAIQQQWDSINSTMQEARNRAGKAEAELNQFASYSKMIERACVQAQSDLKAIQHQVKDLEEKVEKADFVRSRLRPLCPDDDKSDTAVLAAIDSEIALCNEEVQGLKDRAKAIETMTALNSEIKKSESEIQLQERNLDNLNNGHSFFDSLSDHAAAVLQSINESFTQLDIRLTQEQHDSVESFATLFSHDNQRLIFCEAPLSNTHYSPINKEELKKSLEEKIIDLKAQLQTQRKQLTTLNQNAGLSQSEQTLKLKECLLDLEELKQEQGAIAGAATLQTLLDEARERFELLTAEQEEKGSAHAQASDQLAALKLSYNTLKAEVQTLRTPLDNAQSCYRELSNIESRSARMLNLEATMFDYCADHAPVCQPEQFRSALEAIDNKMREVHHYKEETLHTLNRLLEHGIVESTPEDRHAVTTTQQAFETYYSALQTVYDNLERSRENYQHRLKDHNNTAAISARMIGDVKGIVESFIDGINQELQGYSISNLDNVELIAELHPQYLDMVRTLNRVANTTDALLPEDFYQQISAFQNQFYLQRSGKIDIAKIIEKISYQFNRNGKKEAIPQSNGTNCMVNAVMLALLLKHMVPEDLSLSMPVIFDEVGSLDEHNLGEILKVMEEHGLILFAANPEPTGVIASVLEIYHDLSLFKATDVDVQGKAEAIYFPGMEERLETIDTHSQEQGEQGEQSVQREQNESVEA